MFSVSFTTNLIVLDVSFVLISLSPSLAAIFDKVIVVVSSFVKDLFLNFIDNIFVPLATPVDLYNTISKLTYMYDFRTILPGEKKTKATDIVSGAYDFFAKHYGHNRFIKTNTNYIINPHPIYSIGQLPDEISIYLINKLKNIDVEDMKKEELEQISKFIKMYFAKTNFINSLKLAISSSSTLGRKETVKHGLSKVKRYFLK